MSVQQPTESVDYVAVALERRDRWLKAYEQWLYSLVYQPVLPFAKVQQLERFYWEATRQLTLDEFMQYLAAVAP